MATLQLFEKDSALWSAQRWARARALKRRPAFYSGIEFVPFLGFAFTLLVIFMPSAPMVGRGFSIELARSSHSVALQRAIRYDALRVVITRDGRLYFGNTMINPDDLPDKIRKQLREGAERRVYLSVDGRAKYGQLAAVVDQVRLAGVRDISFITEE
jgi:biopolymer transport protein ExbD